MEFARYRPAVQAVVDELWARPELGYREYNSSRVVRDFIAAHLPDADLTPFSTTGLDLRLSRGKARTVAIVAELDAVISPSHPDADPATGAVHACGHHTQVGIACALIAHYAATGAHAELPFDLAFVFVPAEEFVDLDARQAMIEQGTISWLGGKPEAMALGVFDDIDFAICLHAIGEDFTEPTIEINCDLAGFMYKDVTFHGVASHAGFDPFSGTNAYAMASLFTTALGLSRQQLREDVYARMNPVILATDMTTNVIPHEVTVSTDLRSTDTDYLVEMAARIDRAAHGCAAALGGTASVRTRMGYLPFVQDRSMNEAFREAFEADPSITHLIADRGAIAAAGDAGDLAFMLPTAQLSYGGFTGRIHGNDFYLADPTHVLENVPALVADALTRLGPHLPDRPRRSMAEYEALIDRLLGKEPTA